jgi:hypothetical protein
VVPLTPTPAFTYDLAVQAPRPLTVTIGSGTISVSKGIRVRVANGMPSGPTRGARLVASDGTCPAGTVSGLPDFDRSTPGTQDTVLLPPGKSAAATVPIIVPHFQFLTHNRLAPTRCRIALSVEAAAPGGVDLSSSNDTVPLELSVVDRNDPPQHDVHESAISSAKVRKVNIGRGRTSARKTVSVTVRNADFFDVAGHGVTVTAGDGDCPPGTVSAVDFDSAVPGQQNNTAVNTAATKVGKLSVTVNRDDFYSRSKQSPGRCTALLTVTGPGGDSEPANDTTELVIEVVDRNDY